MQSRFGVWVSMVLAGGLCGVVGCEPEDDVQPGAESDQQCDEMDPDPCGNNARCVDVDGGYACQPTCDSDDDCADDGHCDLASKACAEGPSSTADAAVAACRRQIRTVGEGLCCDIRAADGSATNGVCLDGQCKNALFSQDNPRCAG